MFWATVTMPTFQGTIAVAGLIATYFRAAVLPAPSSSNIYTMQTKITITTEDINYRVPIVNPLQFIPHMAICLAVNFVYRFYLSIHLRINGGYRQPRVRKLVDICGICAGMNPALLCEFAREPRDLGVVFFPLRNLSRTRKFGLFLLSEK